MFLGVLFIDLLSIVRKKPRDAENLLLQVIKKTKELCVIDKFIKIYNLHFYIRHVRFCNLDA